MTNSFYFYALSYIPDCRDTWWFESLSPKDFISTLDENPEKFHTDIVIDQLDNWATPHTVMGYGLNFHGGEDLHEYDQLIVLEALSVGTKVVQMDQFNFIVNQPNCWVDVMIFGLLSLDSSRFKNPKAKIKILSLIDFLLEIKLKGYSLITVSSSRSLV
jgi:hypothetical protein